MHNAPVARGGPPIDNFLCQPFSKIAFVVDRLGDDHPQTNYAERFVYCRTLFLPLGTGKTVRL